jgi:hypothetical protein
MTATNLFASVLFSAIGLGAFVYGKRTGAWKPGILGVALMVYPYFFASTAALYAIGAALTLGVFIGRE